MQDSPTVPKESKNSILDNDFLVNTTINAYHNNNKYYYYYY